MKTLVYINPDCFLDTDLSVLKYLAEEFRLIWYVIHYTDRPIYYTPEEMRYYADKYGIELHLCPRKYRQRDPRNLLEYKQIVKNINNTCADIVYSCITEELWWSIAARSLDCPVRVLGLHDVQKHSSSNAAKRFIQAWIQDSTVKDSANICVFSENQKSLFAERYGRNAVNLGMSGKDFGASSVKLPDISGGVRLLFFGNIVKYKGLDKLIACMESLHDRGISNLFLTIAGKGEDWQDCEKLIRTPRMYELKVRFIDNSEIPDLFDSNHFLVLPYTDATQSGPLLIAANYGLPVIAPAFGCFAELYDAGSAVLYEDLHSALERISKMSEDEYDKMRVYASSVREKCSERAVAARYTDYFKSL